jgi:hypothetical protein
MTEQDKRMDNTEIMTIQQLKEYKLLFNNHIDKCSHYSADFLTYIKSMNPQLNEYMNKFIEMQNQEKIIWAFNTNFKCAGSNILLTNKGKILYIEFNLSISSCRSNDFTLINYEINNHNFYIPSYAICALKMLIKNIEGQYTIYTTNSNPKINDNDFNSIYKNINEYLKQIKQEQLQKKQFEQLQKKQFEQFEQEILQEELLEKELLKKELLEQIKQELLQEELLKKELLQEELLKKKQISDESQDENGVL